MGKIYSINPMSFDSGPGIRVEVVLVNKGDEFIELSPSELVDRIRKFRPYFGPDDGGVTFKGNNIFEQVNFLSDTCKLCHKAGISTCIETNGFDYSLNEEVLNNIDFVILNIESLPLYNYTNISMDNMMNTNKFINDIIEKNINIRIKQIIKKGINDNIEYIQALKKFINMYGIIDIDLTSHDVEEDRLFELRRILKEV